MGKGKKAPALGSSAVRSLPEESELRPAVVLKPRTMDDLGTPSVTLSEPQGKTRADEYVMNVVEPRSATSDDVTDIEELHPLFEPLANVLLEEERAVKLSRVTLRDASKALGASIDDVLAAAREGVARGVLELDEVSKPKTIAFLGAPPLRKACPPGAPPARRPFAVDSHVKPGIGSRYDPLVDVLTALGATHAVSVSFQRVHAHMLRNKATREILTAQGMEAYLRDAAAANYVDILAAKSGPRVRLHPPDVQRDVSAAQDAMSVAAKDERFPADMLSMLDLMRARLPHVTTRTLHRNLKALPSEGANIRQAVALGLLVTGGSGHGAWVRLPGHADTPGCALCSAGRR